MSKLIKETVSLLTILIHAKKTGNIILIWPKNMALKSDVLDL
jgi:hypothetical protein